jgi:hypothetical protein
MLHDWMCCRQALFRREIAEQEAEDLHDQVSFELAFHTPEAKYHNCRQTQDSFSSLLVDAPLLLDNQLVDHRPDTISA